MIDLSKLAAAGPALTPYVVPEALEAQLGRPFDLRLGANESLFGPPPEALEAMRAALAKAHLYCDPDATALREAIAAKLAIPVACVGFAAGIDGFLSMAPRAFAQPGQAVVATQGSYPIFEVGARNAGCEIVAVPYRDDRPDLAGMADAAHTHRAAIVCLAHPDNPSGFAFPAGEVEAFRRALPNDTVLLLDEAYADFLAQPPVFDVQDPQVVRVRTFSKAYGLAGMRVAYALLAPERRRQIEQIRPRFGVNIVGQAGATAALGADAFLDEVRRETDWGRDRLAEIARELGLASLPSATNFVAVDFGSAQRADAMLERLLNHGVFLRKATNPPLNRTIRVTVGRRADVEAFGTALRAVL